MRYQSSLVWFRRDLRVDDHAALFRALKASERAYCVFLFDRDILDALPSRQDRRVEFIRESVVELASELENMGGGLITLQGAPAEAIPRLAQELGVEAVFANTDYEPLAVRRDAQVAEQLGRLGIAFHSYKDQVVFDKDELLTGSGSAFSVYTPYKNAWLRKVDGFFLSAYPVRRYIHALRPPPTGTPVPSLAALGFSTTNLFDLGVIPGARGAEQLFEDFKSRMSGYAAARDFPAVKGPSYLSVHLRFGTISVRTLAREAWLAWRGNTAYPGGHGAEVWLSELIWRDFYFHILHHHPHVSSGAFRPEYDAIEWETGETADLHFSAWCEGRTGYPLVDAAMRQLARTGYMHNRLRMVAASFLVKDMGIDWRRGEAHFAMHLNDFDMAANNGGWQWAASTGCDAQPYFRIFNPVLQSKRFDPHGKFIRRYVPELAALSDRAIHAPWLAGAAELAKADIRLGDNYPEPAVDHALARQRTLERFKAARR
ncbi:MAG: deoxyribodipyrimidine photo-lyase [Burkholderiales bacterium]|nr:deoxyribodipyrimidine photo-lyase [Burkholderiales bacterium]